MKILSIDTSSKICSTALLENDEVIDEITLSDGKTHSENLMPIVAEILAKNHLKISEIDLISCCKGPGSFTGIRIGVATVKAIAEVHKLPISSVSSLEILARIDDSNKTKVSLIDARNNQVYCGIFDDEYNPKQEFIADDIEHVIEILKKYDNLFFIGDGAILHKDKILQAIPTAKFSKMNDQNASYAGKIAYKKYQNKIFETADTLAPMYLRKSQAERLKEKNKEK